jgi:hypothetical protein
VSYVAGKSKLRFHHPGALESRSSSGLVEVRAIEFLTVRYEDRRGCRFPSDAQRLVAPGQPSGISRLHLTPIADLVERREPHADHNKHVLIISAEAER